MTAELFISARMLMKTVSAVIDRVVTPEEKEVFRHIYRTER